MAQQFLVHPEAPQHRLLQQVVTILRAGGVIVYPTDSGYALGCCLGEKEAVDRIRRIRQLDKRHNFTLICRDLSEIATYARVTNTAYRLIKAHTPGPFTFIFAATKEVPRRLQHPKRKTIGLRVPDHRVALTLLELLGEPLMSVTLMLPEEEEERLVDAHIISERIGKLVDAIVDIGYCPEAATSMVDLSGSFPEVLREGKGSVADFL